MPTFVYADRCKGCGRCIYICPADNMQFVPGLKYRRSYNADPISCWECYNCVKYCPEHAVEVRSYADFVPLGGRVIPLRDTKNNVIYWRVEYRDGTIYEFAFPIRTTPWDSIRPPTEWPERTDLDSEYLSGEPDALGVPELPMPGKGPELLEKATKEIKFPVDPIKRK